VLTTKGEAASYDHLYQEMVRTRCNSYPDAEIELPFWRDVQIDRGDGLMLLFAKMIETRNGSNSTVDLTSQSGQKGHLDSCTNYAWDNIYTENNFMADDPKFETDDATWTEAFRSMSDEEQIEYTRNVIDKIRNDRESFPGVSAEMIEEMEEKLRSFEESVENERVALRREAEAIANLERSSDAYLATIKFADDKSGH